LSYRQAAASGGSLAYLNQDCFGDPGDNIPGDAPRHFSNIVGTVSATWIFRCPKIQDREGKLLQVRAETFNAFNHQRFAFPIWDLGMAFSER